MCMFVCMYVCIEIYTDGSVSSYELYPGADGLCETTNTGGTCKLFLCSRTRGAAACACRATV